MTTKKPDSLSDLAAICRDDRCDIAGVHLVHEIAEKRRGRKPKVDPGRVVARPVDPPKAKKRGWHKCHGCAGRGYSRGTKCTGCDGKGSVFVGPRPPTGRLSKFEIRALKPDNGRKRR